MLFLAKGLSSVRRIITTAMSHALTVLILTLIRPAHTATTQPNKHTRLYASINHIHLPSWFEMSKHIMHITNSSPSCATGSITDMQSHVYCFLNIAPLSCCDYEGKVFRPEQR